MSKNKIVLFTLIGIVSSAVIYYTFFSTGPCTGAGAKAIPTTLCFIGSSLMLGLVLSPYLIIGGVIILVAYNYLRHKPTKKSKFSGEKLDRQ